MQQAAPKILRLFLAALGLCLSTGPNINVKAFAVTSGRAPWQGAPTTFVRRNFCHNVFGPNTPDRRRKASSLHMSVPNPFDTLMSGLVSICRFPNGVTVKEIILQNSPEPTFTIKELYDVENDASCRVVRETISELDLVVDNLIPAGDNSPLWEMMASSSASSSVPVSDRSSLPIMVVNEKATKQDVTLSGEDEIVKYLLDKMGIVVDEDDMKDGDEGELVALLQSVVTQLVRYLPVVLRLGRGSATCAAALGSDCPRPEKNLILYNYEGNQFCRLVREVLTELDITYELRSVGKGSPRREELAARTGGSTQCPYLVDPNTGTSMSESKDIVEYLYKNYALWTPPNEALGFLSIIVTPLLKPVYSILAPMQAGENYNAVKVMEELEEEIASAPVVVYTYKLSPFCTEATSLLDRLGIEYKEVSLGLEWIPGLIDGEDGAAKRAALGEMTGQTSLPHVFVGGKSVGGLFSGNPGLIPSLEAGEFKVLVVEAQAGKALPSAVV